MGEKPVLTFGEELRRERLIRGVSLEEISATTKISIRLLSALESSDISRLPAPVYSRGFIRAYSRHIGVDPDEMVNAYLADVAPEKREAPPSRKGLLRSRFLRGRRAAAGTIVVSVTATLLLLGLIARPQRPAASAPVAPRELAPVSFKNVSVSPGPALAMQEPTLAMQAVAAPQVAAVEVSSGVSMVLEFDQDSWTEVSADGLPIFTGMIRSGIRREFQAQERFRLTLGNAGGVRVTVDGHALEPLGGAGQVIRLSLPADRQG